MISKRHFSLVRLVKPQTLVGNHVRILPVATRPFLYEVS